MLENIWSDAIFSKICEVRAEESEREKSFKQKFVLKLSQNLREKTLFTRSDNWAAIKRRRRRYRLYRSADLGATAFEKVVKIYAQFCRAVVTRSADLSGQNLRWRAKKST